MQTDPSPWWTWLLVPLIRSLAGAVIWLCAALLHRRATGAWPRFVANRPQGGLKLFQTAAKRRPSTRRLVPGRRLRTKRP